MVYFSDFFEIPEEKLQEFGAFNISLINDLPLFIDPFLLFGSDKVEYQKVHDEIINYLIFLKEKAATGTMSKAQIMAWYCFPEVKQNWLGYSLFGNGGSGLGLDFGFALSSNMQIIFHDLSRETITSTSHLEKAGLFSIGVGRDNISDFTCNLIKGYLLEYSQLFADTYLNENQKRKLTIKKAYFNYKLERWMPKEFTVPYYGEDYVILTPRDILTKDENWINNHDLIGDFDNICSTIPNEQLRAEIHNYFQKRIPKKEDNKQPTQKEMNKAIHETIRQFPTIIDYYIKQKEENKDGAIAASEIKVDEIEEIFVKNVKELVNQLALQTNFYCVAETDAYTAALKRIGYLKVFIENNDGYKLFYHKGQPLKREADLQRIYRLTWFATTFDVNQEPNNGRGPVDYSISKGSKDKVLVEFKLASNSQLKRNLLNQVNIYEQANQTQRSIKVILYFDTSEYLKVTAILRELELNNDPNIVIIDAGQDNKRSASTV
ncbi:MAG: hypothetical protein ACTHML_06265 [Ginsengibacter sp.]